MSSRALRRLQQDAAVIRVPASNREDIEEEDEAAEGPGFASSKSRKPTANPFAMVNSVVLKLTGFLPGLYLWPMDL